MVYGLPTNLLANRPKRKMNRDFNIMAKKVWKSETTDKRVATRLKEVETVEIKDYVRDTDLHGLARNKAYRVDGVHVYADILNLGEMLQSTEVEGETTLRFDTGAISDFFPEVVLTFVADATRPHHHVPLLLSPFAYSTYRGS